MKKLEAKGIQYASKYSKYGQKAEVIAAYTTDGIVIEPDPNTPHYKAGDYTSPTLGEVQVKGCHATVCAGTDIDAYIEIDAANMYAYVTRNLEYVILFNPSEWSRFVKAWSEQSYFSDTGWPKLRLKHESASMLQWLDEQIYGRNYGRLSLWG